MPDNGDKQVDPAALRRSVISTPDAPAGSAPPKTAGADIMMFLGASADEFEPWGRNYKLRDRQLRKFITTESMFTSALGIVTSRNSAFNWRIDGPEGKPSDAAKVVQELLEQSNQGQGFPQLMSAISQDVYTQDGGAFMEIVREADRQDAPFVQLNQLDAGRCWHTGVPQKPVLYQDTNQKWHLLDWWSVITLSEMPTPIETFYGQQMCALTRLLTAAQIIKNISIYKAEKTGGRHNRAIHFVQGLTNTQIQSAIEQYRVFADQQGLTRYVNPIITGSVDPKATLDIKTLELAALPDGFNEEEMFKHYISHIAMAFGSDYQEFAPLPGGNLGTSSQSEILHQKTKGKGPALFRKLIRDAMNFRVLPEPTSFEWNEQDIEADKQVAEVKKLRAEGRAVRIASNEITNEEAREEALAVGDITQEQFEHGPPPEPEPELAPSPPGASGPRGTMAPGGDDAKIGGKDEDDGTPFPEFLDWYNATYAHKGRASPFEPERQLAEGRFQRAVARGLKGMQADVFRVLKRNASQLGGKAHIPSDFFAPPGAFGTVFTGEADDVFWRRQRALMMDELGALPDFMVGEGIEQATNLGLAVNFELANAQASALANTWMNNWWARLENTTRNSLRKALAAHIESGASLPTLQKKLAPLFGATRAKVIATTEVTRMFAEGNRVGYKNAIPPVKEVEWRSVLDSAVDPDCEILDGTRLSIDDSEFPPIHPRCRCWIAPVVSVGTQSGQALGQQAPKPGAPGSPTGSPINWQAQGVNEVALGTEGAGTVRGGIHTANTKIGQMKPGSMPKHTVFDDTRVLHKRVPHEANVEANAFKLFEELEAGYAPTVYLDADGAGHAMRWIDDGGFGGSARTANHTTFARLSEIERTDHGRISLMDALAGNTDRHTGNVILFEGRMYPIDNGFMTGSPNLFKLENAVSWGDYRATADWSGMTPFIDGVEQALIAMQRVPLNRLVEHLNGMGIVTTNAAEVEAFLAEVEAWIVKVRGDIGVRAGQIFRAEQEALARRLEQAGTAPPDF